MVSFLFLAIANYNCYAQSSDDLYLNQAAQDILQKKVTFTHPVSNLAEVLTTLSTTHGLKLSFSNHRTKNIRTEKIDFSLVPTEVVLNKLLEYTPFTFLVVGRVIVIAEREHATRRSDTLLLHPHRPVDNPVDPDEISTSENADSSHAGKINGALKKNTSTSIYSPGGHKESLPFLLQRKIGKLYAEELEWAKKYRTFKEKNLSLSDTIPFNGKAVQQKIDEPFAYISIHLGISRCFSRFAQKTGMPWKDDLEHTEKIKASFFPGISGGFFIGKFQLGTGINYFTVNRTGEALQHAKKSTPGNGVPNSNSGKKDTSYAVYRDHFGIYAIPFELSYRKRFKNVFVDVGGNVALNYVTAKHEFKKFLNNYYKEKYESDGFKEKKSKSFLHVGFHVRTGVILKEQYAISASLGYHYGMTPILKNNFYNYALHQFIFQLSCHYYFKDGKLGMKTFRRKNG